jgi:hypothetical protein
MLPAARSPPSVARVAELFPRAGADADRARRTHRPHLNRLTDPTKGRRAGGRRARRPVRARGCSSRGWRLASCSRHGAGGRGGGLLTGGEAVQRRVDDERAEQTVTDLGPALGEHEMPGRPVVRVWLTFDQSEAGQRGPQARLRAPCGRRRSRLRPGPHLQRPPRRPAAAAGVAGSGGCDRHPRVGVAGESLRADNRRHPAPSSSSVACRAHQGVTTFRSTKRL